MVFPTTSVFITGIALVATLLAANWYVWGLTYASDFRQPHPVRPRGSNALVEGILARFIATAETSVPRTESGFTATASASAQHDEAHGFKKVA